MGLDNPIHIAFLLIVVLLVFGARRLPEMGRSLGSGMRGFKDALSGQDAEPSANASPSLIAVQHESPAPAGDDRRTAEGTVERLHA
jgi:sec-independent protein translocase protein TatA